MLCLVDLPATGFIAGRRRNKHGGSEAGAKEGTIWWWGTVLCPAVFLGAFCYVPRVKRKSPGPTQPLPLPERRAYRRLEDVVGCKWSAAVLAAIGRGVTRPGQLERFIPGISTKVLTERLRKLLDYELISRREYPGKVLRVEYALTTTGQRLAAIIEQLRDLDETHASRERSIGTGPRR